MKWPVAAFQMRILKLFDRFDMSDKALNERKIFCRASVDQRIIAAVIFLVIASLFTVLYLAGKGKINIGLLLGPCGFKQRYQLPCPSCGMTTSAVEFAKGNILQAFYIQPASALLCCVFVFAGFLAFLTAVFGVYWHFLSRFLKEVKFFFIILVIVVIISAGWAVTLVRAFAEKAQGQ